MLHGCLALLATESPSASDLGARETGRISHFRRADVVGHNRLVELFAERSERWLLCAVVLTHSPMTRDKPHCCLVEFLQRRVSLTLIVPAMLM